jgi:hypothetical protein
MQLFCRSCGAEISADGVNLQTMMAKCSKCNAVFSFADMYAELEPKAAKNADTYTYDIPQPGGITMHHDGMDLVLIRNWNSMNGLMTLGFGVLWMVILFFVFSPIIADFQMVLSDDSLLIFGLLLVLPAAGIYSVISGLYGVLNKTMIRVSSGIIQTVHGPLPWPGKRFDAHDFEQLFVSQKVTSSTSRSGRRTTIKYQVEAITRSGTRTLILQGLESPEQAQFIEQEIERHLRIPDARVRGEYGRGS